MRLALHGAARDGTAGRAWHAAVESAGAVLVPIPIPAPAGVPVGLGCDAVLVAGPAAGEDATAGATAALVAFARAGGPVLAIGAGVEILCALGLLPGRIGERAPGATAWPASHLRVEGRPTPFTSAIPAGRVLRLPEAPGPPYQWQLHDAAELQARGQVIFRACDAAGGTRRPEAIAGISNQSGNVVGLLVAEEIVAGEGAQLLRSLGMHLRAKLRSPLPRPRGTRGRGLG